MSDDELTGLAAVFYRHGLLDLSGAQKAAHHAREEGIALTTYLVKYRLLSADTMMECAARHFNLPTLPPDSLDPALLQEDCLALELIDRYHAIPVKKDSHGLLLGVTDPTDQAAFEAIRFHTGLKVHLILMSERDLEKTIKTHCRPNLLFSQLQSALQKMDAENPAVAAADHPEEEEEPVTQFVDRLIHDAIQQQASDIHIEMQKNACRIRFRHDGFLRETAILPREFADRVMTRLKIMAQLNIAERRLPQDGRVSLHRSADINIRLSTCPHLHGEKLVLRLLPANPSRFQLETLGLLPFQLNLFRAALSRPQGLILVTGPTGSGKTATLYAGLQSLNKVEKNILTIEDPVEIELPGITQVNIHPRIGLNFALALRTFLRQDPDIIMVGEIRDQETAAIAAQAAQTGHLVLSTLHTNSAADTIKRLQSMGLPPYQIADSVALIIAQRLVRSVCHHCDQAAEGCEHCHQGYQGRTGIFELLPITPAISNQILAGGNVQAEEHCTLWEAGMHKMQAGLTSYAELVRTLGEPLT